MLKFLVFAVTLAVVGGITCAAVRAYPIPTNVVAPPGSPVAAVGCTAAEEDSDGGYLSDYYLVGNASFMNNSSKIAVEVDVTIRYTYSEYDLHHDVLLVKRGAFSPGVRIDPRRNAAMAFFNPSQLNIDVDGYREIDVWNPYMASCIVTFAEFADGTTWSWNMKHADGIYRAFRPNATPRVVRKPKPDMAQQMDATAIRAFLSIGFANAPSDFGSIRGDKMNASEYLATRWPDHSHFQSCHTWHFLNTPSIGLTEQFMYSCNSTARSGISREALFHMAANAVSVNLSSGYTSDGPQTRQDGTLFQVWLYPGSPDVRLWSFENGGVPYYEIAIEKAP